MSHVTSSWAVQSCIVDPGPIADDIMATPQDMAAAAAQALTSVRRAASDAESDLTGACVELIDGWSAPEPGRHLHALKDANAAVERACLVMAGSANDLQAAINTARDSVRQAYADADHRIHIAGLLCYPTHRVFTLVSGWVTMIDPSQIARIDSERRGVVAALYYAVSAAENALLAAARATIDQLRPGPWSALPLSLQPAAPTLATQTDRTNRAQLHDDLRSPTGRRHEFALAINATLQRLALRGQHAELLTYNPDNPAFQGGVAIAVGDVSTATSVAVLVPGVNNSPMTIDQSTDLAINLNSTVDDAATSSSGSTATVLWFDYNIPISWPDDHAGLDGWDLTGYGFADTLIGGNAANAMAAGGRLAGFSRELRTMMGDTARLTLIGHSYGSIVASASASKLNAGDGVDAIVLLGSPGAGYAAARASDYTAVDPEDVFVVRYRDDPVASPVLDGALSELGMAPDGFEDQPFGPDPAARDFGARVVDVDSNQPTSGAVDFNQHALDNYLDGASLHAVAAVVAGNYGRVPIRRPK